MKYKLFTFILAFATCVVNSFAQSVAGGIGVFSVSETLQVMFSPGNLQFNASEDTHECADGTSRQGITLQENGDNDYYTRFAEDYDGQTVKTVTLNRRFVKNRWSTLCLPFNVNKAMFSSLNFGSRIYEFKYATGDADTGVSLYFSIAKSITAGKGYIVNADDRLAARTSFTFPGVKIDLSADKGEELNSVAAYDNLEGWSAEGNIELVGTLRKGILRGTPAGNTYMGLKENMIYYPNIATGSTILAYRGIFRSKTGTLNVGRVRIVVDGVEIGELRMDNGEILIDSSSEPRKYLRNGVLFIERNGITYTARGHRID